MGKQDEELELSNQLKLLQSYDSLNSTVKINIYNHDFSTIFDFDIGHADVSIDGTTFSYGRYGEVDFWRITGEGILVVGPESNFINQKLQQGKDVVRFELIMTEEEKIRLIDYMETLLEHSLYRTSTEVGNHYLLDSETGYGRYSIIHTNCTTLIRDALMYAYQEKNHFVLEAAFVPSELYNRLLNSNGMVNNIEVLEAPNP